MGTPFLVPGASLWGVQVLACGTHVRAYAPSLGPHMEALGPRGVHMVSPYF